MRRPVAVVLVIVLAAAACTSGSEPSATTTAPAPTSSHVATESLIGAALGTQAVQDFIIHFDLEVETEDGFESLYPALLDKALADTSGFYLLTNGLTFSPADSIDGHVVDSDGNALSNLSIDFGILSLTGDAREATRSEVVAAAASADNQELADSVASAEVDNGGFLVEIITADLSERQTHLGPGDRSGFDIEFTGTVLPGDRLRSATLFGQTLPGDPVHEADLNPHELFAYRWSNRLLSFLGGEDGPTVTIDDSLTAREGSVLVSRETKEAVLKRATQEVFEKSNKEISIPGLNSENLKDLVVNQPHTRGNDSIEPNSIEPGSPIYACIGVVPTKGGPSTCALAVDIVKLDLLFAVQKAAEACVEGAAYLNRRNEKGGIDTSEIDWDSLQMDPPSELQSTSDSRDDASGTTTANPDKPQTPGPVSCFDPHPPLPMGTTFGDVHIATFDGLGYDNHAVGEFLAYRDDHLNVQMRLEPVEGSQGASIVTAVALDVEGHSVSLHPIGQTWIDGEPVDLPRGEPHDLGTAEIMRSTGKWVVATTDGVLVEVSDNVAQTTNSLVLMIRPSALPSIGMFGSPDGDADNDLITRDGEQIESHVRFDFETFHTVYIDSWRITEEESFFHYESGESAGGFLIDGWPLTWMTVAGLDEAQRTEAEHVCRRTGVTRDALLEACIFDVGVTGEPGFAYQAFMVEASTPEPADATPGQPGLIEGGDSVLTVGSFSMELGSDAADSWQCETSDERFWARSEVRRSGELYETTVEYLEATMGSTGQGQLNVTVFRNGSPYAWHLSWTDPPLGEVDELNFNGSSLTAMGTAFLNEPLDVSINLLASIPASDLDPFSLALSCDP